MSDAWLIPNNNACAPRGYKKDDLGKEFGHLFCVSITAIGKFPAGKTINTDIPNGVTITVNGKQHNVYPTLIFGYSVEAVRKVLDAVLRSAHECKERMNETS